MAAPVLIDANYLANTLLINPAGLRNRIINGGFRGTIAVACKDADFTQRVCNAITRSRTGNANTREVTQTTYEKLQQLALYLKLMYVTHRQIDLNLATLVQLQMVWDWHSLLPKDPPEDAVVKFTDGCNKREWLESIQQWLSQKIGAALVPLDYVIREQAVPGVDPGLGAPSFEEDIRSRGRHNGHFWPRDNATVWTFLRSKCFGTTAWTIILEYGNRQDGRGAYLALVHQYLGRDVQRNLLKAAVTKLEHLRFDNKSRNWTFDRFVGTMRQCFVDMGTNAYSEERKVMCLQSAWQVQGLGHLDAMVQQNYNANFNGAVTFLAEQLNGLKLKNGPPNRGVASVQTKDKTNAQLKRELKAVRAEMNGKGKGNKQASKVPNKKKKPNAKFDSKDPKAYVSKQAWAAMSEEEKKKARDSRAAAGIPQRTVGAVRTVGAITTRRISAVARMPDVARAPDVVMEAVARAPAPMAVPEVAMLAEAEAMARHPPEMEIAELVDSDDEVATVRMGSVTRIADDDDRKPAARFVPPVLLRVPQVKKLVTTQREATYANFSRPAINKDDDKP